MSARLHPRRRAPEKFYHKIVVAKKPTNGTTHPGGGGGGGGPAPPCFTPHPPPLCPPPTFVEDHRLIRRCWGSSVAGEEAGPGDVGPFPVIPLATVWDALDMSAGRTMAILSGGGPCGKADAPRAGGGRGRSRGDETAGQKSRVTNREDGGGLREKKARHLGGPASGALVADATAAAGRARTGWRSTLAVCPEPCGTSEPR